jgi:predicted  nucleic acid-binding Zn-ribbon protein
MESLTSGTMAGTGSFRCRACGYVLTLTGTDMLTDCPGCGGRDFARASLFSTTRRPGGGPLSGTSATPIADRPPGSGPVMAQHERAVSYGPGNYGEGNPDLEETPPNADPPPDEADTLNADVLGGGLLARPEPVDGEAWLERTRAGLRDPGEYLAYEDGSELRTVPLTREWTRIGRSLAADIRFDDPTVSRRHALVVRQADGVHVLDDRSLNGVFVNGSRIEGSGIAQRALADGDEIVVGRYRLRFIDVPA